MYFLTKFPFFYNVLKKVHTIFTHCDKIYLKYNKIAKISQNLTERRIIMYTILVSQSEDKINQALKELFSGMEQARIVSNETPPEHRDPPFCRINTAKGIYNIPHDDILFVESEQKKSVFHMTNNSICLPIPLYRIREALPELYFIQTHRSFIVNLKNISYIDKTKDPWVISFFGSGKKAFVSRNFRKDVMKTINPLLSYTID
ncbi:MAG: LytR/AlgR family response regulator transcription factor [Anaerotignum sp.]